MMMDDGDNMKVEPTRQQQQQQQQQRSEPGTLPASITSNLKRTAQMIESEDYLEELERKLKKARQDYEDQLNRLEDQRKQHREKQLVASLRLFGRSSTWTDLLVEDSKLAWKKEIVLAILSCNKNIYNLPASLREDQWEKCKKRSLQNRLCLDIDIFSARMKRSEFQSLPVEKKLWWFKKLVPYSPLRHPRITTELTTLIKSSPKVFAKHYHPSNHCCIRELVWVFLENSSDTDNHMNFLTSPGIPLFFHCISESLWKDHDLMLLAAEKLKNGILFLKLTTPLKDSIDFAMDFVEKFGSEVEDHFQLFTERVRSNLAVAEAFCNANGKSYPHVVYTLRKRHESLARYACKLDPTLLLCAVPREIERILTKDKNFVLPLFSRKSNLSASFFDILAPILKSNYDVRSAAVKSGCITLDRVGKLWEDENFRRRLETSTPYIMSSIEKYYCSDEEEADKTHRYQREVEIVKTAIRSNRHIALEGFVSGRLNLQQVPYHWKSLKKFWRKVIQENVDLADSCPFAHDIKFIKTLIEGSPCSIFRMMELALSAFPTLQNDLDFWRRFLSNVSNTKIVFDEDLEEFLLFHHKSSTSAIFSDKESMILACSLDCWVYRHLHVSLKNDRDILEAMINSNAENFFEVLLDEPVNLNHPYLVIKAAKRIEGLYFGELLANADWEIPEVVQLWLSRGGEWREEFPDEFTRNEELMLLVAENRHTSFHVASEHLKNNKDFLLKALSLNGMVYRYIDNDLKNDSDIVLTAWATSKEVGDIFFAREEYRFVTQFATKVRQRLSEQDIFFKTVLCGISATTKIKKESCPLRILLEEQGSETSLAFRKQLAAFLDIPTGKELAKLRRASEHLEFWRY